MRRLLILAAGLALVALGAAMAWWGASNPAQPGLEKPPEYAAPPDGGAAPVAEPAADADLLARILGTWRDHYRGRRTMTLHDDGTAAMVCELDGLNARLFTPVLNLDLRWQLEDGVMTRVIVGGEPADKVRFVVNLMGARADEKLLKLTETELHLLDADGKTEYHWTRLEQEQAPAGAMR